VSYIERERVESFYTPKPPPLPQMPRRTLRQRIENTVRSLCEWVAPRFPVRDIEGADGDVYLSRYRLLEFGKSGPRIYLHAIRRSDEDPELHNHPWRTSLSFILAGGYFEERRVPYGVPRGFDGDCLLLKREIRPFTFNRIDANTFHRVDLRDGVSWSLFFAGPTMQTWGFWNRETYTFTPWRDFIRSKGLIPYERDR
jgi:hypothetical protein